ncbi:hypothetical protein RZS08_61880, partial [Arthrospira platensis SPKY1]|nr:hypothetical protein [Arthrospira platensis SPKY1]
MQAMNLEIEGEAPSKLFTISQKSGGHLINVAGEARFAEQSNYTGRVTLRNSQGEEFTFDRPVFLAVIQRDFNTNNFSVDPLAIAANRDGR